MTPESEFDNAQCSDNIVAHISLNQTPVSKCLKNSQERRLLLELTQNFGLEITGCQYNLGQIKWLSRECSSMTENMKHLIDVYFIIQFIGGIYSLASIDYQR